jgi:hypothetical protein
MKIWRRQIRTIGGMVEHSPTKSGDCLLGSETCEDGHCHAESVAFPLMTESYTAICRLVMHRSAWIMSSAPCNMSGLVVVAGCPDRGRTCSSVSPFPEALTLWTSVKRCSYRLHNLHTQHTTVCEYSPHFLSLPLRIQLQLVVCNVFQTQAPFSQTTTAVLSVGRPCT